MVVSATTGEPMFYCRLGVKWPELLARNGRTQISPSQREAFQFNPRFHCQEQVPDLAAWQKRMATIGYSPELPVCWIPHPLLGYPEAYWPTPRMLSLIHQIASGALPLSELDDDCFALLSAAHILVLPEAEYSEQRQALQAHWRNLLATERYLHIPNLFSPLQVAALRDYTRERRRSNSLQWQDDDYTRRIYKVFDPVGAFWHQHLLSVLSPLTEVKLRPSYNVISYYEDTQLVAHTDREPCIWNVSVQLDTLPASAEALPWPLWLETQHGNQAIILQAGDGLIYKGREMKHWRDPMPSNRQETVMLFHFVDEAYEGELY
jgi:hypothetical protein